MPYRQGNTVGNINNTGYVTAQDGFLYLNARWKEKLDGTGDFEQFSEAIGVCNNVVGDWIYYIDLRESRSIAKAPIDGSSPPQILVDEQCNKLLVVDDWLYFVIIENNNAAGNLYKMRTDGRNRVKLNNDISSCINVLDDRIYYISEVEGRGHGQICVMRLDGSNKKVLSEDIRYKGGKRKSSKISWQRLIRSGFEAACTKEDSGKHEY